MELEGRRGVASVIGTVFFVLVFMLALGALAYSSETQSQGAQAQLLAESVAAAKGAERLAFAGGPSALSAENGGGASVELNHLLLTYPNGTTFALPISASVPAGGELAVAPLVQGSCGPGAPTCLARYESIIKGDPAGSAVGVLTSLGNTFWYYPADSPAGAGPVYFETSSVESTISTTYVVVPGLAFNGTAGDSYVVQVSVGYWQSGVDTNPQMFAISVPAGTTFMFCGGRWYSTSGSTDVAPENTCTSGGSLGDTGDPLAYCMMKSPACEFVGTAFVTFGTAGTFKFEFEGLSSGAANVLADSVMAVTQEN